MPRRSKWNRAELAQVADAQDGLVTASQLAELGIPSSTVSRRVGESWSRVLPGVHLVRGGDPHDRQRLRAALLYAGEPALVTASSALTAYGIREAKLGEPHAVHLLIPHKRHRASSGFVVVERTTRFPEAVVRDSIPYAPIARAAIDSVRRMRSEADVRALLARLVQREHVSLDELAEELRDAPRPGTGAARTALEELRAGVRSLPEGELRSGILRRGMDEPWWNPTLLTLNGRFLAQPDAYFDEGVALEVDSREHHLSELDWKHTMERHGRMTACGIFVLHAPPSRIRGDRDGFLDDVERARDQAQKGPRPLVVVRPIAA